LTDSRLHLPSLEEKGDITLKSDLPALEIKDKKDCSRYSLKLFLDVEIKDSPLWMRKRLIACGLQPINNIVDTTNYLMLETGQPMHAFDLDDIGKKIIVRRAKKGEKITTLGGQKYKLDPNILLITDTQGGVGIAGIKGGERGMITKKTKNIAVEMANFNPSLIRKASKKLKLRTDASWRFENGISPELIDFAEKRLAYLIKKTAGGKTVKRLTELYPEKQGIRKIKLNLDYLRNLLGHNFKEKEISKILKDLGCLISQGNKKGDFIVSVPKRRLDLVIQEDLIEEVGRIFGYQNIPANLPRTVLIPPERNNDLFWEKKTKHLFKEKGFSEVYNYSFISEEDRSVFGWSPAKLIEIANPVSSFNKYLRPSLIPGLLKNARDNLKNFKEVRIFELGKIFNKVRGKKVDPRKMEKVMLSGFITGSNMKDEGFYKLKGVLETFFNSLGIAEVWYDDYKATPEESKKSFWHPGKTAEIKIAGEEVGFLGQINLRLGDELAIRERVFLFEIDFSKLSKNASEEQAYQAISFHPAAVRDLALLVPQETKVVEVLNTINRAGGKIIKDVDLFDIYGGDEISQGKKSLAFHIIYQSPERTLSSKEIKEVQKKIVRALEENLEWEVRQ
jgi:phenylalanyl-tRNA synthetase beta chain